MARKLKYTKEDCLKSARNYLTPNDWVKQDYKLYWAAHRHGWLDECKAHMIQKHTIASVIKTARKYKTSAEWRKEHNSAAVAALTRLNCMFECTCHMVCSVSGFDLKDCFTEAMKHNNELEWLVNSPLTYKAALRNHWLEFCADHMEKLINLQKAYYTFLECELISMHFSTATKWRKVHNASWKYAESQGWIVSKKGQRLKLKFIEEETVFA